MATLPADGTLLVPVANRETVDRLLATAINIARERSMRILVLHVVEVPAQLPLSEGEVVLDDDDDPREMLDMAAEQCEQAGIEVETRLRYARDVATGIVGAVSEHSSDALLMGWRGRPRRRDIVLGSFLDRVIAEAPCDVFIKRIRRPAIDIDSILVPVADGPHCELSITLADALARQHDASVSVVHIVPQDASTATVDEAASMLDKYMEIFDADEVSAESSIVRNDHAAGKITDLTATHDLTILGATRRAFLKRKLVGSVAEGVGRSATSQVVVTRSYADDSES